MKDHQDAIRLVLGALIDEKHGVIKSLDEINAIGHRVVHGMKHLEPEIISKELLDELHHIELYDPDQLPGEIEVLIVVVRYTASLGQASSHNPQNIQRNILILYSAAYFSSL